MLTLVAVLFLFSARSLVPCHEFQILPAQRDLPPLPPKENSPRKIPADAHVGIFSQVMYAS